MRVWKDIFRTGKYTDHNGERHTFTPAHVQQANKNLNTLLKLKHPWTAPAIWEHDPEAAPIPVSTLLSAFATDRDKRAGVAKHTFGHPVNSEIRMEHGKPVLWAEIDIPDEADAKQFEKVKYVSPRIDFDATDPKGRRFPGASVFHIAATNRPIQIDQKPVNLSAIGNTGWKAKRSFYLSENAAMADEADDVDTTEEPGDDISELKSVLAELGHGVPDEAMDLPSIIMCLKTHAMSPANTEPDGDEPGPDDQGPDDQGPGMTGSVAPAMLSGLPTEVQQLVNVSRNALANVTSERRATLLKRLTKIEPTAVEAGLMTPAEVSGLKQKLTTVNLSFTAGGELVLNSAVKELQYLERLVKNVKGRNGNSVNPSQQRKTVSLSSFGSKTGPTGEEGGTVNDAEFKAECDRLAAASLERLGYGPAKK